MKKIIITLICFLFIGFVSCKTFKVEVYDSIPECNDFYNCLKYYYASDNGDSAFIGVVYEECKKARKLDRCAKTYFPDGIVDRKSANYIKYLECLK